MSSVPRLYEKMYARVHEKVADDPPARQRIFRWALGVGREVFRHQVERTSPGLLLQAQAPRSRTRSSSPRSRSARAAGCVSSSRAARRSPREIAEFFGAAGLLDPARATASPRQPGHHRQPPGTDPAGHRGPAPGGRRGEDRGGRRDPHPRAPRDEGLLQEARGHRGGDRRRTAGSTPATSGCSTRTASSSSPTARRTSSSPRAARTSPPSPSRTASSPTPSSPRW